MSPNHFPPGCKFALKMRVIFAQTWKTIFFHIKAMVVFGRRNCLQPSINFTIVVKMSTWCV